jgi:hypothetical protein
MYRQKMVSSLQAGEITDLEQKHLKQEFTKAVQKLGFVLQENKKCSLSFQHQELPEIFLALTVAQDDGAEVKALDAVSWGTWELQNQDGQPLCVNGQDGIEAEGPACAGFWLEGLESIPGYLTLYTQYR